MQDFWPEGNQEPNRSKTATTDYHNHRNDDDPRIGFLRSGRRERNAY
jgi:hypothetical protein